MNLAEKYIGHLSSQKRYSPRTVEIYFRVLVDFLNFAFEKDSSTLAESENDSILEVLTHNMIRSYQIDAMDRRKLSPRTVCLHLSVLSGFCRFLMRENRLSSNPAALVVRPKQPRRLPVFYAEDAMRDYVDSDNALTRRDFDIEFRTLEEKKDCYMLCLNRIIVLILYTTGIRRSELISLRIKDVDFARDCLTVRGKGDKMREIPMPSCLKTEIDLYLNSVRRLSDCVQTAPDSPLLVTMAGEQLYPVLVDRAVKSELGAFGKEFSGRKSPHVLRHTLATELLDEGADINSIKEVLGHANLAATQIYTHSSPSRLKQIYELAHPRAKQRR